MRFRRFCELSMLIIACGCSQARPDEVTKENTRTIIVSADDPFIRLDDGSRIGVDGVPDGESIELQIIETTDEEGRSVVDIDTPTKTE